MRSYSVPITRIVVIQCTACHAKMLQLYAQVLVFYKRITLQLCANYENSTVVLLIKTQPLRYFLRLRLRRDMLR